MDLSNRASSATDRGGVPEPDPIARDYLLLALRLGTLMPGLVDAYFGPPELKALVDEEPACTAAKLREDASAL